MFTLIPLSKDKHFAVTAAYSPRLFYSWTALWSIIHTKLILCWSPAAKRLRHRINYIIYTRMIIVYDSVKHWGISPCVITTVVFGGQLFSLLSLILLMWLFPHCAGSLGVLWLFFFFFRNACDCRSGMNRDTGWRGPVTLIHKPSARVAGKLLWN